MIVIIDYGMGNLESVKNAVLFLGKEAVVTASPERLQSAKKIIFPGVGHFAQAVKQLESRRLIDPLKEKIKEGVPFLGICLGMHLLFEKSSEAQGVSGLGVIKGKVSRFDDNGLIVPHMGWNQIKKVQSPKSKVQSQDEMVDLFEGIEDGSYFYFAHSYFCQPREKVALATTDYGQEFVSALGKKNIWGIQFHPEKSQKKGLKVLENFLKA
ncbi:MAG: imidazole glycerol phosphate synthase subunit HisH [Candidatus Omnitrophica bacterium]|nr:imidazole glycerol phosphate synthase subunit HisH [Candidatus Omnitrophota bacterium]MCF7877484.1 imidazole glycerol phosphate synthase subunit HisH [Candidatus Omnitrophota bacterium]MCF7891540.1 imidazole glycerol phosphate synthase subunit HisH [Candidatus Omnitrophota bacterium]MCF7897348.1 imidazole glycerol phosphate synthase subunit HisH [Candidatus Omnitrophota bacterium]MCF7909682.1 imidazole glycerol phosphate synthase subunit HisH [Candidatus Omnitrophota bacterium]